MPSGTVRLAVPSVGTGALAARPVLASTASRDLFGNDSPGRVLAVFRTAVYVELGAGVMAVVSDDGLRLPNAAVLPVAGRETPFAVHGPGDLVELRDGVLRVGPVAYRPVRWWTPRAVLPGPAAPHADRVRELGRLLSATAPGHEPIVARQLADAAQALHEALVAGDVAAGCAAADAVLGLGPGLTPSGDDLLAGILVTCGQLRSRSVGTGVAALGEHVAARAGDRTPALSAALLRCAADGLAAEPVLGLIDAVVGRRPLGPALCTLLSVGHTSGHDTARGVHVAAAALLDRTPGAPLSSGADPQEAP